MYREFYGLQTLPFSRGLPAGKLFSSRTQDELRARLEYLLREPGIGLVTGEVGSGKSTAVRAFAEGLEPARYAVMYFANPMIGITGLYRELLSQLGEPLRRYRQEMVPAIRRRFDLLRQEQKRMPLIILDEAQLAPSPMLEELRLLLNVRMDAEAAAVLVLVGHSELRRTLCLSIHQALWQRTAVRIHLRGLNLTETGSYIQHHLQVAGYRGPGIFSDGFISKAHDYSKGIPRQINLVCTHALISGCAEGKNLLDEEVLRKVVNDLETGN